MTHGRYAYKWQALRHRRPRTRHTLALGPMVGKNHAGITFAEAASSRRRQSLRLAAQVQGDQHMDKFLALLKSRKFWAAVAGLILIIVQAFVPDFPLDAEQVTNVIFVIVAFILGTGLEDGLRAS